MRRLLSGDRLAHFIPPTTAKLRSGRTLFGAAHLLGHGVSDDGLICFTLRDKLWASPRLLALLGVFIVNQLYVVTMVNSSLPNGAAPFDVLLVCLANVNARPDAARVHPQRGGDPGDRRAGKCNFWWHEPRARGALPILGAGCAKASVRSP